MSKGCSSTSGPGAMFSIMATTCEVRPRHAGVTEAFSYPGFVPAYIRPLFCRGIGPFRWAALSGDPADIAVIDDALRGLFPADELLQRWLVLAPERVAFQGLPARICWLGYGDRAKAGLSDQRARPLRRGQRAGRDRARPPRRGLRGLAVPRDGGDARRLRRDRRLADPQRARQRGGGRDAGSASTTVAVSASGSRSMLAWSCSPTAPTRPPPSWRVLTTDPGMGVVRHLDAGYPRRRLPRSSTACRRRCSTRRVGVGPRPQRTAVARP